MYALPAVLMPMPVSPEMAAFNAWLSYQLKRRGLNQTEFAERAGVAAGVVSNWVTGRRTPTIESAARIADALDVDVSVVLARLGADVQTTMTDDERLASFLGMIRRAELTPDRIATLESIAAAWLRTDKDDQP